MKKLALLTLFFVTLPAAFGEVSTRVCEADGKTPFDGRDIMVGTRLTIIVSSDSNSADPYPVDLIIEEENRNYGFLFGARAFDEAGTESFLYCWEDDQYQAISFQTGEDAVAGDWFIADYEATDIGDCDVAFYDYFSFAYNISFRHVRTRDFDGSIKVDFTDFTVLASYWQDQDCNAPNWCEGTDLDVDGDVDLNDLTLFIDYWLEVTRCNACIRDFNKDGEINFIDFTILTSHWLTTDCICPGWCQGTDIDTDGDVDFIDFALFGNYWLE